MYLNIYLLNIKQSIYQFNKFIHSISSFFSSEFWKKKELEKLGKTDKNLCTLQLKVAVVIEAKGLGREARAQKKLNGQKSS